MKMNINEFQELTDYLLAKLTDEDISFDEKHQILCEELMSAINNVDKAYIILVEDDESNRPWIDRVYSNRKDAEEYCNWFNKKGEGGQADFISEEIRFS